MQLWLSRTLKYIKIYSSSSKSKQIANRSNRVAILASKMLELVLLSKNFWELRTSNFYGI